MTALGTVCYILPISQFAFRAFPATDSRGNADILFDITNFHPRFSKARFRFFNRGSRNKLFFQSLKNLLSVFREFGAENRKRMFCLAGLALNILLKKVT